MTRDKLKSKDWLTEEDRILWNRIGETVTPLRHRQMPSHRRDDEDANARPANAPQPNARQLRNSYNAARDADNGNSPRAVTRLDDSTARKLKKGRIAIDGRIDLHGMTQARAHTALFKFLEDAFRHGYRVVLVITGKGKQGDGILRRAVPNWLEEGPFRALAGAWRPASREHGGDGALYVRLRRRDKVRRQ